MVGNNPSCGAGGELPHSQTFVSENITVSCGPLFGGNHKQDTFGPDNAVGRVCGLFRGC